MKKRFRKTLALLLAALMIAGLVPGFSLSAFADGEDDYPVITADSEAEVTLDNGERAYFKFVPEKTDYYAFYSTVENMDTYGYIYLVNPAEAGAVANLANDDGGIGNNFRIEYVLEAETVYYLGAGFCGSGYSGTYTVKLETLHQNDGWGEDDIAVQPTCTAEGSASVVCKHCNETYSIPIEKIPHPDENEDGICDVCEEVFCHYITEGQNYTAGYAAGEKYELRFKCLATGDYKLTDNSSYYNRYFLDPDGNRLYESWNGVYYYYALEEGKTYSLIYEAPNYDSEIDVTINHYHSDADDDMDCDICGQVYRFAVEEDKLSEYTVPAGEMIELLYTPEVSGEYRVTCTYGESGSCWSSSLLNPEGESLYGNYNAYDFEAGKTYSRFLFNGDEEDDTISTLFIHKHIDSDGDGACDKCEKQILKAINVDEETEITIPAGENMRLSFTPSKTGKYKIKSPSEAVAYALYDSAGNSIYTYGEINLDAGTTYYAEISNNYSRESTFSFMVAHAHVDADGDGVCDLCEEQFASIIAEHEVAELQMDAGDEGLAIFTCPRSGKYYFWYSSRNGSGGFSSITDSDDSYVTNNGNNSYTLTEGKKYFAKFYAYNSGTTYVCAFAHVHADTDGDCVCDICEETVFTELTEGVSAKISVAKGDYAIAVIKPAASGEYSINYSGNVSTDLTRADGGYVGSGQNGRILTAGETYYYTLRSYNLKAENCSAIFSHVHKDSDSDHKCDICGEAFEYTIIEDQLLELTLGYMETARVIFECERTGKYIIRTDSLSYGNVYCDGQYVGNDSNNRYSFTAGKVYEFTVAGYNTSGPKNGTVLLKHCHTDADNDMLCDVCEVKYRFTATLDEKLSFEVPADEQYEVLFTPEADGTYSFENSFSSGSVYQGDNYVYSNWDSYNNSSVYNLKAGKTYSYVLYTESMDLPISITVRHAHSGPETVILAPGIASDGFGYIVCKDCGETIYGIIQNRANSSSEGETDELRYEVYTKGSKKEIRITDIKQPCPENLVIPSEINGIPVTAINSYFAEMGTQNLKSVTLPDTLVSIGNGAFLFSGIESVTIPDSVKVIGEMAFAFCNNLKEVELGTGIGYIGKDAFTATLSDEDREMLEIMIPFEKQMIEKELQEYFEYLSEAFGTEITSWDQLLEVAEANPDVFSPDEIQDLKYEMSMTETMMEMYQQILDIEGSSIETIVYGGSEEEFEDIIIAPGNEIFETADLYFNGAVLHTATLKADGEIIGTVKFAEGQKSIDLPDVPKKEGYTGSWPEYSLGTEDITIEAVYKINSYYAVYKDGESTWMTAQMEYGSSLLSPENNPKKDGYELGGWLDADGKAPGDYDGMPAKDLTFDAVWIAKTYTVTFNTDGGSEIAPINVAYGAPVPAPADPTKEGFVFDSWSPAIPETMPANNITVTAQWRVANPTAGAVLKTGSGKTVDFRASVTVIAKAENVPDGYIVAVYDGENELGRGDKSGVTYTVNEIKENKTFTAKVIDASGNVQKDAAGNPLQKNIEVKVKTGFFDKIIAFFRGIFRLLPKVTIEP